MPPVAVPSVRAGALVGPYRLLRILAEGGMGSVWLAERSDGLIHRPVALKVPRGSWRRAGLEERLERERGILATLNHPNIARLYDAGLTADGQPFMALEYVEGRPIDVYCEARSLDIRSRLRLFLQVADAVAHAHAKLVVHLDLKPPNILVTDDGQVRLLDFGIAKILGEGEARQTRLTLLAGSSFTAAFASPEQIAGEPLTTASDVYSLGVVLYALVAGVPPYRVERDSLGAWEEAILRAEPVAPSAAALDVPSRRMLRGDLDTIVLKALKKASEERYVTVHALAHDIARYLDGRPVLAQPDSARYRLRKFLMRHKLPVSAAAGAVLAILVGTAAALWQARVAIGERDRAERVKEFIASIMRDAHPDARNAGDVGAADLLHAARARADRELVGQPAVRLELLSIIGETFYGLRSNAEAAEVLEQALRGAEQAPGTDPGLVIHLHRLLSQAYAYVGRHADARRELHVVFNAYEAGARPPDADLIEARLTQATLAYYDARYPESLAAAREALRLADKVRAPPAHAHFKAYEVMAGVYQAQEHLDLAVQNYERAYRLALNAYGDNPRHPRVLDVRYGYANTLEMDGRPREALSHAEEVLTLGTEVFGPDSEMVGYFVGTFGNIQLDLGKIDAAIENSRKSLAICRRTKDLGTRDHSIRMRVLGRELLAARQPQEAAELLAASLEIEKRLGNVNGQRWSGAHYGLAMAHLGRFDEAQAALDPIVNADETTWSRGRINALWRMGTLRRLQGDARGALALLERALALTSERPRSELDRGEILAEIGLARADLGSFEGAVAASSEALELLERVQVQATPAQADALVALGRAHIGLDRPRSARPFLERADAFWRGFDAGNPAARDAAQWLGRCQHALDRRRS